MMSGLKTTENPHPKCTSAERDEAQPVAGRVALLEAIRADLDAVALCYPSETVASYISRFAANAVVWGAHPHATSPGADDFDLVCTNGHDRCEGGAFEGCPYCEKRPIKTATSPGAAGDRVRALIECAHDSVINRIGEPGDYRDHHMLEGIERLKDAIDVALRSARP